MTTQYGDISPRTAAYAAKDMLERGIPFLVLEQFGQSKPLPKNETKSIIFRRYESLDASVNELQEGVTPAAKQLTKTDVQATLKQIGDRIELTDVVEDTHEDPVMQESSDLLGEQAAEMVERVRFNVLKGGTSVYYANGSSRSSVNTPITRSLQRRITRSLKRQNARKITKTLSSTPAYGTQNVDAAFVAACHPDLEGDIRNMPGFTPVEEYGSRTTYESEIGKVEDVRYVSSTVIEPWESAGGAPDNDSDGTDEVLSSDGSSADVYPILFIARDAYGIVPLKGDTSGRNSQPITPMVVNPKPSDSDPMAQRGHVAWKAYQTASILNDAWMVRAEVAASDEP